jgi:outer membrane protein TolC
MRRALTLAMLLGGCVVGPTYVPPSPPATSTYDTTPVPPQIVPGEISVEWWRDFGSPELDRLVAMALTANSDLEVAEATLRRSREEARAAGAALFPTIDAGLTSERSKSSNYLSPVLNAPVFEFTLQTAQVSVSYPLDLFGGVRRAIESARAATEEQYYKTAAARLTLTSSLRRRAAR